MPDLTKADVQVLRRWQEGDKTGKYVTTNIVAKIVSGTAGSDTAGSLITPEAFGLREFVSVEPYSRASDNYQFMQLSADGKRMYVYDPAALSAQPPGMNFGSSNVTVYVKGVE